MWRHVETFWNNSSTWSIETVIVSKSSSLALTLDEPTHSVLQSHQANGSNDNARNLHM